jgi:hypothetical protein
VTTPQESIELLQRDIDSRMHALEAKVIRLRIIHERAVERPLVTRADGAPSPHEEYAEHEKDDLHCR